MERNSSKIKSLGVLALVVLLVLTALLYANKKFYGGTDEAFENKDFILAGELNSMPGQNSTVYFIDDMLLELQGRTIRAKNIGGNITWSESLAGNITKVTSAGENIIMVDSTKVLSCLNKKGKVLWSYNLPYDCMELYTQENGAVLIEYKNSSGCRFDVLNSKGGKSGSGLVENSYILSFSTGGQDMFSISVLDVSSDSVNSKILTYDFKGNIIWANNFDNEIISSLAYDRNNDLIALGESTIYKYRSNGELAVKEAINGGIAKAVLNGRYAVVITKDRNGFDAGCYDSNLKQLGSIALDKVPQGIYLTENGFILFDKDGFVQYNSRCGRQASYDSTVDVMGLHITGGNKFYLESNRKLQLLESR